MANLRVIAVNAADIRTIKASFTDKLDPLIGRSNVSVYSLVPGVPDAVVNEVTVSDNKLSITVRPLTPHVPYIVKFQSTSTQPFRSLNGDSYLFEDGRTNLKQIVGPEEPNNAIRANLITYLRNNLYNLDQGTLVRTVIDQIASDMLKARRDVQQAKSDNYLSVTITDERHTRGTGPYDRLFEEGAYEVLRVGKRRTGSTSSTSFSFDSFPYGLITLQRVDVIGEQLEAGNSDVPGTFDKLVISLENTPVTKLTSLVINYQSGTTYTYDIRTYGYQIHDPRYDTDFASTLLTLEDNQIKLSDEVLADSNFSVPGGGDTITVSYEYKSLGRFVDETTVAVTQTLDATREATPALTNQFTLAHAPIVTSADVIASTGGVQFLDPNSATPFLTTHPAFTKEVPFKYEGLPASPGEYAVNYTTGQVFVFGATSAGEGTGNFPPAATYIYRSSFRRDLDYTYNPDTLELVASPLRELGGQAAKISFSFEQVMVPGVDYKAQVHTEEINERIENRLTSLNSLQTLQTPITNAFRVFNETTGEVYPVSRFNDTTVFFSYKNAPRIADTSGERATFTDVLNETLILSEELTNTSGVRIFKIPLLNNRIMSVTDDVIGSSFNTSVSFSRTTIFATELYFDGQILSVSANLERLTVGDYQIDYQNGVIYVGVSSTQDFDLGTASYKKSVINPLHPHLIAVSEVYYSLNLNNGITKHLDYTSFGEGEITPTTLDIADERFLNDDTSLPYNVISNTITVSDDIKAVRHIFDVYDLNNHSNPVDFGQAISGFSGATITLDDFGVEQREQLVVGTGLTIDVTSISPGIQIGTAISVIRLSDDVELLDGYETVVGNTITLSGSSGAVAGDAVYVIYSVVLNGAATPVVDYDHGGFYVDYTYLLDEILVSYEHGDNVIDYRESDALNIGEEYFVTYRIGALRDALLSNFGSLVDIDTIKAFDTSLSREIYRDALMAALQSFTKGPTIPAMKLIAQLITKIEPEIIEAVFQVWSLGISRLYLSPPFVRGDPQLVAGKFDQGILITKDGESVTFPVSSNLRLEEGTLETWIIPDWNGLDNDATLTFSNLTKDGYAIAESQIFIGASSFNPVFDDNGSFTLNRTDDPEPIGLPSAIFTRTGVFIYYDIDGKDWKVLAKDKPQDGYDGYTYSGTIVSSGEVYNAMFIPGLGEIDDILRSGTSRIDFEFHLDGYDSISPDGYDGYVDGYVPGYSFDGIEFMADDLHYVFDFADTKDRNRFSVYKDGRGYMNFEVWDHGGRLPNRVTRRSRYLVSADIQDWKAGEKHHVACAWKLSTADRRDEMHLFIDGFEVPNILRYGGRPKGTSSDRFRTVKPELIAGTVPLPIITGNDLQTTAGSATVVSSSIDFSAAGIVIGNTIDIKEQGFGTYTITSVLGNVLVLSGTVPATLSDARFSVNEYSVIVESAIDLSSNIVVSLLRAGEEIELPGLRAELPGYEISKNSFNENVLTLLGDAEVGDQILVRTLGLNHRRARDRIYLYGDTTAVLRTALPPPINLDEVTIRPVLMPLLPIGPSNAVISLGSFVATGLPATQPTSATEGRTLEVRVTGGNVDFSTPTTVTINGTTATGPTFETLSFSAAGTQQSTLKFKTITGVDVTTTPITTSKDGVAVEIKEAYAVTYPDGNSSYPVIRFAYQTQTGKTLEGDGSATVSDANGFFPASDVGNLLVINAPPAVAGNYTIDSRIDNTTITVSPAPGTAFSGATYSIYNISIGRSGFQNGFFFFEEAGSTNVAYPLPEGVYEFDYAAYLEVPFDPITQEAHVGSDFQNTHPVKAVLDEFRILNRMLTDTRVGETIAVSDESITTNYQALHAFRKNNNTLMLLHFDSYPLENDSNYIIYANREYVQSGTSVNENFGQSILITDKGMVFDNDGRLTTRHEGSIEFWVSPRYDTYNDPFPRFYFDATSTIVEDVTSITKNTVKVSRRVADVLSVRLQTDTQDTATEYYGAGRLSDDRQTLILQKALPFQQTPVKVAYVPTGLQGDRISIFKDTDGFITLNVHAQGEDYQVRQPVFWKRDSWHRVRVTFKFNRTDNLDEIRLFIDGEERGVVLFGSGLLFGEGIIFGQTTVGVTNQILITDINFLDTITQFFVGSDYLGFNTAQARIDNLRLSNVSRDPITVSGQPIDANFNTNSNVVFPVIEDAFTTFLLDFDRLTETTDDFTIVRDEKFGIFNFTMNIIDSFGIVSSSEQVRQLLESLILALKPANAKAEINYFR
jgi:hypothetical protein